MAKKVIMLGWHPSVVDYVNKWPNLSEEKLFAVLEADRANLQKLGYEAELAYIHSADTAATEVEKILLETQPDCVSIGAGVRTDADYFLLFEQLINIVHKAAPQASICFNTNAHDLADAVKRWI